MPTRLPLIRHSGGTFAARLPHTATLVTDKKATVLDEDAKAEIGQAKVTKANDSKPNP